MIAVEQGAELIRLARDSIESFLNKKSYKIHDKTKKEFSEELGVFVTLEKNKKLRGCIGFPEPYYPLYKGVYEAARSAAFSDPRFPPVSKEEWPMITVEVSVLTRSRLIEVRNPEDYLKMIEIGKDGLIVRAAHNSGLLLPQVAVEWKWNAREFLQQTCNKAGLHPDSWTDFDICRIYKFQSQVFSEESPNGRVLQKL